jgi:GNAT superfamily N-acetyltransferase
MTEHRVRRATGADLPAVAAALGTAFSDDPVLSFLLPHGIRNRARRLRSFFALEAPRSLRHGGAWTSEDGGGAAIWYPPAQWREPTWTTVVHGPAQLRVFGRRIGLAGRVLLTMQQHHPPQPHWYLLYLGATVTGEGRGSALLRAALAQSDAAGMPAYLEGTSERNVALYRRHGFRDLDQLPLPGGGPPLLPMWRDPA